MDEVLPKPTPKNRLSIPLWVALAGMALALIVGALILSLVIRPIASLVFPSQVEVPLPAGTSLIQEFPPTTSDGEWLYGTSIHGCEVMRFYAENGSQCNLAPFICSQDEAGNYQDPDLGGKYQVGTCTGSKESFLNSYSWEVLINANGGGDYPTRFRVYLYQER
jgi:hypothetical protein